MVIEVEGMSVNANLDARNKDLGYIVFLRKNEKMDQFYEWYENNIVYPYFRQLLFQYHQIPVQEVGLIPEDKFARFWSNSDMQQTKRLTSLETMQRNMKKRIFHNKIGAKYTGRMQPCDLDQSFKILKSKSRTTTLKDQESPLKTSLVNGMKKMRSSKRLLLPKRN